MRVTRSQRLAFCTALSLAVTGSPAWAQTANRLQDLVGARGAGGETELERRGYTHIDTSKSRDAAFSYWWSNEAGSCVRVTTRDGRYQALMDVDPSDCGQTRKETGMSDGAKVAVGAAALLGIAALLHKSHHRDDRNFDSGRPPTSNAATATGSTTTASAAAGAATNTAKATTRASTSAASNRVTATAGAKTTAAPDGHDAPKKANTAESMARPGCATAPTTAMNTAT